MIPFSRILLCLTLHYLIREKEQLSTCISNAFTFNYFCFFFCVIQWNTIPWFYFIAFIFLYFFPIFILLYSIYKTSAILYVVFKTGTTTRTQKKFQHYNCTHPCTPMRLYVSTAIPVKTNYITIEHLVLQIVLNWIYFMFNNLKWNKINGHVLKNISNSSKV